MTLRRLSDGTWIAESGPLGVWGYRTPWGALVGLRRLRRMRRAER